MTRSTARLLWLPFTRVKSLAIRFRVVAVATILAVIGCDTIGCEGGCGASCCGEYCGGNAWRPCLTLCMPQDGWASFEFLGWWQDGMQVPALVTTSLDSSIDRSTLLAFSGTLPHEFWRVGRATMKMQLMASEYVSDCGSIAATHGALRLNISIFQVSQTSSLKRVREVLFLLALSTMS